MKHILSLSVALLMACVAFAQNITDFYRPGGFDYNGASIKTFSVSDTTAVQFSRGNLQYNAALDKWRFALRQYEYICGDNANIAEDYDGWIDLFGWGTSGWNSGATAYQPWATSETASDYYPGGSVNHNLAGAYANADWGIYNKIENGGKFAGMWRTLTKDEWSYLVGDNTKRSGKWGVATIAGIYKGLLLLPDEWTIPSGCNFTSGNADGYNTNSYTYSEWEKMQSAGAIFLPAAGYREGTDVDDVNVGGYYWTSTSYDDGRSWVTYFRNDLLNTFQNVIHMGRSVRLVRRVQTPLANSSWVDMGLPSGTLWYSCNIGTTKPQGYGAYFAWGETKPKANYEWSTYAYGTGSDALTKYYDSDGLTVLESGDDAAKNAFGASARIPTKDEWQELWDNCTGEWTKYNGVNGYMLTSNSNGNRIFLPAAGYRYDAGLSSAGEYGRYWSASLLTDLPGNAWGVYFNSDNQDVGNYGRRFGLSLRAVKGGSQTNDALAEAFDENGASIKTFTVAEGRTVHFSKGNLWYNAAANLWRFAPEQYEYIGEANSNISETYGDYIDLFGWGTSGWNSGANDYQPWATSSTAEDYFPGNSGSNNLTGSYANADWGVYNAISNGGNSAGMWRTLTNDEWEYLINTRSTSTACGYDNVRYVKATVSDIPGVIIFPDSYTHPNGVATLSNVNTEDATFSGYVLTQNEWKKMELEGCIFLPAAGCRVGTSASSVGTFGSYWSSTSSNNSFNYVQVLNFNSSELYMVGNGRSNGRSVRLVKD